ncbi:MAG TPA: DUF4190 domain-containing protein [Anaerolineaceae bacterium]
MAYNQSYTPQPSSPKSTKAIISLVAGILGWTLLPILGGIVAVITGHLAKKEIKESNQAIGGGGMATAGLILGYANVILLLCPVLVIVVLALLGPAIGNIFSNVILQI